MARMTMSTVNRVGTVANLKQYGAQARVRAQAVVAASAERVVEGIAMRCPYDKLELDDFHMIEHIEVRVSPQLLSYEAGFSEATFAGFGQPPYFIYTEFGTLRAAAQPCVFPARDEERPRFIRDLGQALQPRPGDLQ